MKSPSVKAKELERRVKALQEIVDGLRGKPFSWGDGEATAKQNLLVEFGIHLLTATAIKKRKMFMTKRAKPVGYIYFPAPISKSHPVYLKGVHCEDHAPLTAIPSDNAAEASGE